MLLQGCRQNRDRELELLHQIRLNRLVPRLGRTANIRHRKHRIEIAKNDFFRGHPQTAPVGLLAKAPLDGGVNAAKLLLMHLK